MAHTLQGEDLEKDHRRNATLSASGVKNSKVDSSGLESRSRGKSTLVTLKRKYPYSGHNRFQPLPPYYTGPPHPAYYHPYYYHYPIIPRSYHPNNFPTTPVAKDNRFSTNPKKKASKDFDPATRKTDANTRPQKDVRLQKPVQKQKEDKKKQKATIIKKGSGKDEVNTKKNDGTGVIPAPPILQHPGSTVNPTLSSNKRPPLSTKSHATIPTPPTTSSTKGKEIVNAEQCKTASLSTENDLERDLPSGRVSDGSRHQGSCREVCVKRTSMELEELGDALDSEIKLDSFDFSVVRNNESSHWNEVTDPVDLKLMSSAKFVAFQNLGAGLDSNGNLSQKEKPKQMLKYVTYTQKSKKRGRCPVVNLKAGIDPQPNTPFSSKRSIIQKRLKKTDTASSSKSIPSSDSRSGHCGPDPIKGKEKEVVVNPDCIESRLAMKSSEKISDCETEETINDKIAIEQSLDRNKDEVLGLLDDSKFYGDHDEGNTSDEGNAKDCIYDSTPPFPMDDITESIRFHCYGKKPTCELKTGSGVGASDSHGIFRIPSSLECQKEEVTKDKSYQSSTANTDDKATVSLNEVEKTDDDVCLDSLIRSLISEDGEEDSLIRPPSPCELSSSLLPVVELLEPPIFLNIILR